MTGTTDPSTTTTLSEQPASDAITVQPSPQEALDILSGALQQTPIDAERIPVSRVWSLVSALLSHIGIDGNAVNVQDATAAVTEQELEQRFQEAITELKLALGPGENDQPSNPQVGFVNLWNLVYALIAYYKVSLPDYLTKQPKNKKEAASKGLSSDQKLVLLLRQLVPIYSLPSEAGDENNGFRRLVGLLEELATKAATVPAYWKTDLEQLGTILAGQKVNGFWNNLFNGSAIDQMKGAQNELMGIRDGTRLSWVLMVIQGWQEKQSLATATKLTGLAQQAAAAAVKSAASAENRVEEKIEEANSAVEKATKAEQRAVTALEEARSAESKLEAILEKAKLAEECLQETKAALAAVAKQAYQDQQEKDALLRREEALLRRAENLDRELTEVKTLYANSQAGSRAASQAGSLIAPAYDTTKAVTEFLAEEAGWDPTRIFVAKNVKKAFCPRQTFFADEFSTEGSTSKSWNIEHIPEELHDAYRALVLFTNDTPVDQLVGNMILAITPLIPQKENADSAAEESPSVRRIKGLAKSLLKLRKQFSEGEKMVTERQQATDGTVTLPQRAIHARALMLIGNDMRTSRTGLFPFDDDGLVLLRNKLDAMGGEPTPEEVGNLPADMQSWFSASTLSPANAFRH